MMKNNNLLKQYAQLITKLGVNVQPGQIVILNANVDAAPLVRHIVEEAYALKAKYVQVNYRDEFVSKLHYQYRSEEDLCDIPQYFIDSKVPLIKEGACLISIISPVPEIFSDIDDELITKASIANHVALKEMYDATLSNKNCWTIAAYPNEYWASKIYPTLDPDAACDKLMNDILETCRIKEDVNIIDEWINHNNNLRKHSEILNNYNFKSLKFTSAKTSTNLEVGLVKDHVWCGGSEYSQSDIEFNPNLPTEEIFTMPDKYNINGVVYSSKPLDYNGKIVDDFYLVFKDGKVVDYKASKNEEALKTLIEFDEGSCYLGEVALVEYNTMISLKNILFENTLFDENASCHLALGSAYPMNIKNGTTMSEEQLKQLNANVSKTHVDFMFGTNDMNIVGTTYNGEKIQIFRNGNFVI